MGVQQQEGNNFHLLGVCTRQGISQKLSLCQQVPAALKQMLLL
jgi:hypothetical protein